MVVKIFGHDGQAYFFEIGEATTYSDDTFYKHYDGGYQVYNPATGVNLFANKKWMNAESVADRMI